MINRVAGNLRLVRLHQDVRVAAGDDATYDYYLADGARDRGPVLCRVPSRGAVRVRLGNAGRHSASSCSRRHAGHRLQQSAIL